MALTGLRHLLMARSTGGPMLPARAICAMSGLSCDPHSVSSLCMTRTMAGSGGVTSYHAAGMKASSRAACILQVRHAHG